MKQFAFSNLAMFAGGAKFVDSLPTPGVTIAVNRTTAQTAKKPCGLRDLWFEGRSGDFLWALCVETAYAPCALCVLVVPSFMWWSYSGIGIAKLPLPQFAGTS